GPCVRGTTRRFCRPTATSGSAHEKLSHMHEPIQLRTPARAWVVVFAGTSINLCLGMLYAWSVWKANLVATPEYPAGSPMAGLNAGWVHLTDAQATWAYALCGLTFALCMIPGGLLQDRFGPRAVASASGLLLCGGCLVAGLGRSYLALIAG